MEPIITTWVTTRIALSSLIRERSYGRERVKNPIESITTELLNWPVNKSVFDYIITRTDERQ